MPERGFVIATALACTFMVTLLRSGRNAGNHGGE